MRGGKTNLSWKTKKQRSWKEFFGLHEVEREHGAPSLFYYPRSRVQPPYAIAQRRERPEKLRSRRAVEGKTL